MNNNNLKEIWNLPNILTILRIVLIAPFLILLFADWWIFKLASLAIFIIASFTDLLDGWLARKLNKKTKFGNFMDPLADKLFVAAALISLPSLEKDLFPFWMVFLILSREFVVTYLRVFALSKEKEVETMKLGKTKTTLQLITIAIIVSLLILKAFLIQQNTISPAPGPIGVPIGQIWRNYFSSWANVLIYTPSFMIFFTMLITVFSGIQYIYKNRVLFFTNHSKPKDDHL
jgi:CDP-diacylglycerol--glycerol-3-phosphate 3-phosphatidyltransferase